MSPQDIPALIDRACTAAGALVLGVLLPVMAVVYVLVVRMGWV